MFIDKTILCLDKREVHKAGDSAVKARSKQINPIFVLKIKHN